GRFVNPITVCWRCIFPLSLGSVQVGKGDLPDTSNPGSPRSCVRLRHRFLFVPDWPSGTGSRWP
ncbi:TraU family protein, partial [Klebsiella pneumoniae]|nr:TraU family protein [Klebsiella pneumoniae]